MYFCHVINPFPSKEGSEHRRAQDITFASISRAKDLAETTQIQVDIAPVVLAGEEQSSPAEFGLPIALSRDVTHVATFKAPRRLPLVSDLLNAAHTAYPEADWTIFTNIDISLQKEFYVKVSEIAEELGKPFAINRRTISNHYTDPTELESMYSDRGDKHPGIDCFVFPTRLIPRLNMGHICIGAPWFGRTLTAQLDTLANGFTVFKDEYLTFHIGNDETWRSRSEIEHHNLLQTLEVLEKFARSSKNERLMTELRIAREEASLKGKLRRWLRSHHALVHLVHTYRKRV